MIQAILPVIGTIIDKIIPDKEAAAKAKLALIEAQQRGELAELEAVTAIITAEAKSEHVITATWRPITMLTLVGLLVLHFMGFTSDKATPEQVELAIELIQYGLTGYILGRSAEKSIKAWKNND